MAVATCLDELSSADIERGNRLELVTAQRDQLKFQLTAVMRTLSTTCPSDEHRETYNAAWALLAEHGVVPDERFAGFERSYAEWEGRKG